MKIARNAGFAPNTNALARELDALSGPCVGCDECQGLCMALIEALTLPDVIVKAGARSASA